MDTTLNYIKHFKSLDAEAKFVEIVMLFSAAMFIAAMMGMAV